MESQGWDCAIVEDDSSLLVDVSTSLVYFVLVICFRRMGKLSSEDRPRSHMMPCVAAAVGDDG
jgi:hypothetical protein